MIEFFKSEKDKNVFLVSLVAIVLIFVVSVIVYVRSEVLIFLSIAELSLFIGIPFGFLHVFQAVHYLTKYQGVYPDKQEIAKIRRKYQILRFGIILEAIIYSTMLYFFLRIILMEIEIVNNEFLNTELVPYIFGAIFAIPALLGSLFYKIVQHIYPCENEENFEKFLHKML